VRRFDDPSAAASDIAVAQVIAQNDDEIGTPSGRGTQAIEACAS
jgi:hypothetical protein